MLMSIICEEVHTSNVCFLLLLTKNEKVTKKLGMALPLPPLIWTKSKRVTVFFSGNRPWCGQKVAGKEMLQVIQIFIFIRNFFGTVCSFLFEWPSFCRTKVRSLSCLLSQSLSPLVEICSNCWICQSCSMYFLPFAKGNQAELNALNESKYSMLWVCCAFGNV